MTWQNPWAWAGLAFLALPVLVHLLSRAPASLRPFPSLRFIDASRLSPRRRTRPRDLLLLAVRLGILAAAVAALAGPSVGREKSESARMVRAIVLDTSASMRRPLTSARGSVLDSARRVAASVQAEGAADGATSIISPTADVAGAIAGVISWLRTQPGMREIVIVSDFQRGALDSAAPRAVPPGYGLRLVRVRGTATDSVFTVPAAYPAASVRVTARSEATELLWSSDRDTIVALNSPANHVVTLHAGDAGRAALRAAVTATLGAPSIGTLVHLDSAPRGDDSTHRVDIVYPGFAGRAALLSRATAPSAPWITRVIVELAQDRLLQETARASRRVDASPAGRPDSATFATVVRNADGHALVHAAQDTIDGGPRLLLVASMDAGSTASAALVTATLRGVAPSPAFAEREPLAMGDDELRALERPATDTSASASSPDVGEWDGRWLWVVALLLLLLETLLRRAATPAADEVDRRDQAIVA